MKKTMIRFTCLVLMIVMLIPAFASCNKKGTGISNEETPLVIASEAMDGVFNPFFYTNGADGSIVGMTQIGMLSTDETGKLVCGKEEDCVALDFSVVTYGSDEAYQVSNDYKDYYTEYTFALKNGIKFSNGATLSIKDVLFNLYVLLDPSYTGSSTLYSVDIQGMKAYRAQTYNENEQNSMDSYFAELGAARIKEVTVWCESNTSTKDEITEDMQEVISKAETLFKEELTSDWASADSSLDSYKKYGFTETWEVFLYMEGQITVKSEKDKETKKITYTVDYNGTKELDHSKDAMIEYVYNAFMKTSALTSYKSNLRSIIAGGWATASNLLEYFKSVAISDYFADKTKRVVPNISGITASRGTSIVTDAKGNTRALGEECDILTIRVNGVDPKAIYNFSFTVAPMSYYSTEDLIKSFSIEKNNFGVAFADSAFFDQLQAKQVPVGAGPYKASNSTTTCEAENAIPSKNEFFSDNVVYFERNNNFYTVFGTDTSKNPLIRKLRYKVISTEQMYNAVTGASAEVYYAEPSASSSTINKLATATGVQYALADNLGYGYIGVNAKYVNDINIRRAIMYCMNTSLCLDYYGGEQFASILYRSMSSNSWAYPDGCQPYYLEASYVQDANGNWVFDDDTAQASALQAANLAGYSLDAESGLLTNAQKETLTFTFTIAGDSNDHPAYQTLSHAADLLNEIGFNITVTKDAQALSKLASGGLQVWAAAWSSTIDPDMYQVYHKKSSATSIKNWGFPWIMEEGTTYENDLLDQLAYLIEDARATIDQDTREELYAEALNIVMELAVELASYQRKNLFVWNSNVIDSSTLCKATAYQSPLSKIWTVSLLETK